MSLVDKLKDMLVPQTEKGVRIECGDCGSTFEEDVTECPACGSQELIERESFEMRPSQ
jgi:rRNA maturation endonuclease Nob1